MPHERKTPNHKNAIEQLCRNYWYPLYVFVRRQGHSPEDAEDLTQEFFAKLLAKNYLKAVDREKGRFRTFLLIALKRFLANEWDRLRAQKRGGNRTPIPFDTATGEMRYEMEPAREVTPERIYDRRWAMALLDQTMARLRHEFELSGKASEFEHIKGCLTAQRNESNYAVMAEATGMTEGALRVAIHRLRRRFREVFREEIAHTVSTPEEIDEEVRYLVSALAD